MNISKKIKELRKARKLTQVQLANELNSTQKSISNWEAGKSEPTIFSCMLLADVFQVSLDELCCRNFKGVK